MNRREFALALGAAVVAGGMPAAAVELAKLSEPELASVSDGLSVTFDYEDGTKVGPFGVQGPLERFQADVLTLEARINRSSTVVGLSLYMDGNHIASYLLTHKQSVVRDSTVYLSWPIKGVTEYELDHGLGRCKR
jgi:hypothetical protein